MLLFNDAFNADLKLQFIFKNILCYCSTQIRCRLLNQMFYLKTSYVIVQLTRSIEYYVYKFI